jgi:hypothetical protein
MRGRKRLASASWNEAGTVYSNLTLTASRPGDVIEVTCEVSSEAFVQLLRKEVEIKVRPRQTTIPTTTISTKSVASTASTGVQPESKFQPYYSSPQNEIVINLLEDDQQLGDELSGPGWEDDSEDEDEKSNRINTAADERIEWPADNQFKKENRQGTPSEELLGLPASGHLGQPETSGPEYDYTHLDYINQRMMNSSFRDTLGYDYSEQVTHFSSVIYEYS